MLKAGGGGIMRTIYTFRRGRISSKIKRPTSSGLESVDLIWKKMNSMVEKFKEEATKYFICRKP